MTTSVDGLPIQDDPLYHRFMDFLRSFRDEHDEVVYRSRILKMIRDNRRSLEVDFRHLGLFDPTLTEEFRQRPDYVLGIAEEVLKDALDQEDEEFLRKVGERVHVRLMSTHEQTGISLRGIRSHHVGTLITLEGVVTSTTEIKPLLTSAVFYCVNCKYVFTILQEEGKYSPPYQCENNECQKAGPFKLLFEKSEFIDWQRISIQEMPEELPAGQMPQGLKITMLDDLVGLVRPGDRVRVAGVLHARTDRPLKRGFLAVYSKYVVANSSESLSPEVYEIKITEEEEKKIKELSQDPFIHGKVRESIAASIYGQDDVKEAISLVLFGGTPKELPDGLRVRGESNLLLVGDPGVGKSQLLKYVTNLAPRAIYTSGKGASAAGLTAAVMKEPDGGMTLEAGTLVLADQGIAAIDEFDKMRAEDRSAIHEAMEQHTISIAKAGINATLNARTTIIAAANPKRGVWNKYRDLASNLNLLPTILSRFDLIFVMADEPDPKEDYERAKHILDIHRHHKTAREPPIDRDLLRKYISYARQRYRPVLSEEAHNKLLDYYMQLRTESGPKDDGSVSIIAITPRQLESLIRLTESRARMALQETASLTDASAAIRLMEVMMQQLAGATGTSSETRMDATQLVTGRSRKSISRLQTVEDVIDELLTESDNEPVKVSSILERCESRGLPRREAEEALEELKREGIVYQPRDGRIGKI